VAVFVDVVLVIVVEIVVALFWSNSLKEQIKVFIYLFIQINISTFNNIILLYC
jgi:hypothetical protein